MRRTVRFLVAALAVAPALGVARAPAATPSFVPGEALVRFAAGTPGAVQLAAHAKAGATVVRTFAGTYELIRSDLPLDAVLASYRNDPAVKVAEPNYIATIAASPDDPCVTGSCAGTTGQWSLVMSNAIWDSYYTASAKKGLPRITVAVLDTKIDSAQPDFANAGSSSADAANGGQLDLANARDWIPASQQQGSAAYHGTYVAGLVAAATNNATGVAATGSRATVLPLTVVDGTGKADAASLADAIVYAWQRGARVINLSLGLASDSQAVHDAIKTATSGSKPALVVAAAGNNTGSAPFYPGSYPEVMSVAGTNIADGAAVCSNYNANVSVSAPAENVVSLAQGSGFTRPPCGTSAAAPQVSGLVAVLLAQDASRTPSAVRAIIESSADDLGPAGRDDRFGTGRINVERALRGGPVTRLPRATIPPAAGGASTITATASSPNGIKAARVFVDAPSSTPLSLGATDGSFGGTTESLSGSLNVTTAWTAGPHPIWVSAYDGTKWGPAAVGVLIVDATPPVISNVAATNSLRATSQPVTVTFKLSDEYAPWLSYGIQVFDVSNHVVFQEARPNVVPGSTTYNWMPASSVLPGSYTVKIIAVNPAGRSSATNVGTVVA